ncbi:cytochrome-b5 reductase [Gautieria morchelliformis]|nr:cytochrome-b5 reductase [Gautieria morchelliformis]
MLRTSITRSVSAVSRRYSTQAEATSKSKLPVAAAVAAAAGAGGYYYYFHVLHPSAESPAVKVQVKSPLDPEQFQNFRLQKVVPYNHNTSTFVFELPDGQASMLPVASCVIVKASDPDALKDAKGKPIIRPYTPVSHPDLPGELHFLIKKYDAGNASKYIHSLKEGDNLAIKGPIPKYPFNVNEFEEVVLIGGGSGITPLYQILSYALPDKNNKTKFKLLFGNVTEKDILLREQLDELKRKYPDTFDIVYVLSKADKNWKGGSGYITKEMLKNFVAPPSLGEKVKVFVCGPPAQVAAIAGKKEGGKQGEVDGILKELGYTSDQVFKF